MIRFPLFEEAVRGALGVITHSTFLKQHVESCFSGPVARISLAYDARPARTRLRPARSWPSIPKRS